MFYNHKIAVVIPAYRVEHWISEVIKGIPDFVDFIIVVEDCSVDRTSEKVIELNLSNTILIRHKNNKGVGGAMKTGFLEALKLEADIIVKMDGDNQMNPEYLPALLYPLVQNECDYIKGNRFNILDINKPMPAIRKVGNQALTFLTKMSSGYWHVFDPQNGYLAIRASTLKKLKLDWIDDTYFFENSMLINLNIIEARVSDVYIPARYGDEKSSMNIMKVLLKFPFKLLKGFFSRIFYRYIYLDLSPIAILFVGGGVLLMGGTIWGLISWYIATVTGKPVPIGTFALGLVPILIGFQMLLNAFILDIQHSPKGVRKIYDFSKDELRRMMEEAGISMRRPGEKQFKDK